MGTDMYDFAWTDSDLGYSELAQAVNANPNLTSLTINNHADKAFFHHFGDHISEGNGIQNLEFMNSAPRSKEYFIEFLMKMKKIEHLAFKGEFKLFKSAFLQMIEVLSSYPSLKYLSFPRNGNKDSMSISDMRNLSLSSIMDTSIKGFIPENEKFSFDDAEVIAELTKLKTARPDVQIFFGDQEFQIASESREEKKTK
jgi:hypothetical protein